MILCLKGAVSCLQVIVMIRRLQLKKIGANKCFGVKSPKNLIFCTKQVMANELCSFDMPYG